MRCAQQLAGGTALMPIVAGSVNTRVTTDVRNLGGPGRFFLAA